MNETVLEKIDNILNEKNEEKFQKLIIELDILIENLHDCPYLKAFFWSAKTMMEVKVELIEKKKILKIYRGVFLQMEGECK